MTNTKKAAATEIPEKEQSQTYRGYRIEVSLLCCEVPQIHVFCDSVAQAKSHIDSQIRMLEARR